jgi:catechol 2,3-dioxygenase-like lactoylglutathione lyase family enzyme
VIDHISVGVSDLERSARFYETTLAELGLSRVVTRPATIGFGKAYPEFWINLRAAMKPVEPESGVHICLRGKIDRGGRCVPCRGAEGRWPVGWRPGTASA